MHRKENWGEFARESLAMAGVTGLGYWPLYVIPFVIGALIDGRGLDEVQAGFVASVEVTTIALSSLLMSRFVSMIGSTSRAIYITIVVIILGNLISAVAESYSLLLVSRLLVGFGEGIALATGTATVTHVKKPDRLYALVQVGRGLIGAISIPIIAYAIGHSASAGPFLFLALLPLLALPVAHWLPTEREKDASASEINALFHSKIAQMVVLLMAAMFMVTLGESFWYSFIERKGTSIGMDLDSVAMILSATIFLGILGAGIPAFLGNRYGRILPLLVLIVLTTISGGVSLMATTAVPYVLGAFCFVIFFAAITPFAIGLSTVFGRTGAVSAAIGSMIVGGHAIGPTIAGFTLKAGGFPALSMEFAASGLCAIVLFLVLGYLVQQRKKSDTHVTGVSVD
ncbi:MFS transporter [Emcibacter nanhaiensis]|uniref:MFS transporter n=1 Tax=Emcibacter nanhaiensis TaxID=1505037 RepID=A0A501PA34_9PROT|nr:MFS transporter [Emcibacter nanhaiensis]TPD56856.1 MFS transporter [Emcibacter nanhaiensis]